MSTHHHPDSHDHDHHHEPAKPATSHGHEHETHNHNHNHNHSHAHTQNQRLLAIAFALISVFMVVEVIGGWVTGSLALLSDAGHMLSDSLALGMTLIAFIIGKKSANEKNTFGYRRFEILIALLNGLTLVAISVWIVYEAILRLQAPPEIASTGMLVVSFMGLVINLIVAKLLHGGDTDNLNMRSAYLHVLTDLMGSVAAIIAALLIMGFGWVWADAVVSVLVSLLILKSGYGIVKNAGHILMEGSPDEVTQSQVINALTAHPQVLSVHDLHIWSITSGVHSLSCHIVVSGALTVQQTDTLLHDLQHRLEDCGISHSTIQIESADHHHVANFNCDISTATTTAMAGHHHH